MACKQVYACSGSEQKFIHHCGACIAVMVTACVMCRNCYESLASYVQAYYGAPKAKTSPGSLVRVSTIAVRIGYDEIQDDLAQLASSAEPELRERGVGRG